MIKNESGQVAMKFFPAFQKMIGVGGIDKYVFAVRNNLAMSWIDEEDVEKVRTLRNCNCGTMARFPFMLATQEEVDLWTS